MNLQHNSELLDRLAAEYVLGTLRGGARRRFEHMLRDSMLMRQAVAAWQDRLHPMAQFSTDVQPPSRVWERIAARTGALAGSASRSVWTMLWNALDFWRMLGMGSTAIAALLVGVLVMRQPQVQTKPPAFMSMMSDDKNQPMAMAMGDPKKHIIIVKMMPGHSVAADRSLELWAVPKEGHPRSLGLVRADGMITLPLPDSATPQAAPVLAVTLEPKGGSPKPDGPTGPVMFKGAWLEV